jgi:hypothetical protein
MNALIALFALIAVASAVDYYGAGNLHLKNQKWNKEILGGDRYGVDRYGSVIGGYGVGLPQTYGQQQMYGQQSYGYNPISYAYGVKPTTDDFTYGYGATPIHHQGLKSYGLNQQYGQQYAHGLNQQYGQQYAHGRTLRVEPVTHNTYGSVQPILSKTISTFEPQVHHQGKSFINTPTFTSYFHKGSDNLVKPDFAAIRDVNVADLGYKTVQEPISLIAPQVHHQPQYVSSFKTIQEPISLIAPQVHHQPKYVSSFKTIQEPISLIAPQVHHQPQYVSSFKTIQEPISLIAPQVHHQPKYVSSFKTIQEPIYASQYAGGWQDAELAHDVEKVGTYGTYEHIPKVASYGAYENFPKVATYGNYESHIPKVGLNYDVLPKVSAFGYSNTQSHLVEPKVISTHSVIDEDYKK